MWVYTKQSKWVGNLTLFIMLVLDTTFGIHVVNKYQLRAGVLAEQNWELFAYLL